jgi:phage-related protein
MAKKTISNLNVVLGATVAPFVGAFQGLKSTVGGFVSSIGSAGKSILKFTGIAGAIGGILGAAGVGLLVKQQMEAIDGAAKLSDRLGIATESLMGMKHAADLAGVSDEQLTKGLTLLQKNMSDAVHGGKETSEAFAQLGLNAKDLIAMPTDQAFGAIADKLNGVGNVSERAALSMKIFGKSGAELAPLLAEGADGIAAAVQEAEALGLTFIRIDAAKVEEANDAITRMKSVVVGVFRSIAIAISPFITSVANTVTAAGKRMIAGVNATLPVVIETVRGILSYVVPIVTRVTDAVIGALTWLWGGITNIFNAIYAFIAPIVASIASTIAANWQTIVVLTTAEFYSIYNVIAAVLGAVWQIVQAAWSGIVTAWNWALNLIGAETTDTGSEVKSVFQTLQEWGQWLAQGITLALNTAAYAITHWRDTFELAGAEVALFVVRTGNQIAHVFTKVIPALLTWFIGNWRDIFTTIWNFTTSVFTNLLKNIGAFFSAVKSFLKGDGFDFKWTGLTEGFESTIKELPQIAEREIGPREKALAENAAGIRSAYAQGFGAYLAEQEAQAKGTAGVITDAVQDLTKGIEVKPPTVDAPKIETPTLDIDTEPLDDLSDKTKKATNDMKLLVAGSAEAMQAAAQARFAELAPAVATSSTPKAQPVPAAARQVMRANAKQPGKENEVVAVLRDILRELTGAPRIELSEEA